MLPDAVTTRYHDRKERTTETFREVEGSGLECDFDSQDGALGKQEEALSGLDGSAGAAQECAGGRERALRPDEEVPPALEMAAENRERGDFVSGDSGEREGQMEEGEAVGKTLVERHDDVTLPRVDVFEAVDVNTQTEEAGGNPGPPALGGASGEQAWQRRGEAKDEPCRTEEDEDGCPGPDPSPGEAYGEMAAQKGA